MADFIEQFKEKVRGAPASLGFRMPAEWESHSATWIAWPHHEPDWPGKFEAIPWVYAEIVRHLVTGEDVHIIVNHAGAESSAQRVLKAAAVPLRRVRFHRWQTDRVWTRDSGPIFIISKPSTLGRKLCVVGFGFNAWAKYPNFTNDAKLPERIAENLKLGFWDAKIETGRREIKVILEGGSIDVDGLGTMLTTEECLLSKVQQRNPGLSRSQLETIFEKYLGVRKVIWLGSGIAGDDTHGHVDDIARFVASRTVVAAVEPDPADVNYKPLQENLKRLRRATDCLGRRLRVLELRMPSPVVFKGQRLPASYANFYICNAAVLVPVFNDPNDRIALNLLARVFPKRKIVGIYTGDFIWGFGAMHCMTQQQPAI